MRIVVYVLLYLECLALFLHLYTEQYVEVHILGGSLLVVTVNVILGVICVLYILALVLGIGFLVDAEVVEFGVHVLGHEVLAGEVHHGTSVASLVDDEEAGYACILCHLGIVGTKGGCDVHDTGTVLGGYIVAGDYAECLVLLHHGLAALNGAGLHPGHQLLVLYTNQFRALAFPEDFQFLAFLCLEVCRNEVLGNDVHGLLLGIGVLALDGHVVNLGTYAKCSV